MRTYCEAVGAAVLLLLLGLSSQCIVEAGEGTHHTARRVPWADPNAPDVQACDPPQQEGVDLWVDTWSGSDENTGLDPEHPLKTIRKAAKLARPGTTVHILPGVYRQPVRPAHSGTEGEPIVYLAEEGPGTVFVRGSKLSSSLTWQQLSENTIGLSPDVDPGQIYYADLSSWGLNGPPRFIIEIDDHGYVAGRLWPAREPDWQVVNEWRTHELWWSAEGGSQVTGCDPLTDPDPHCDLPSRSFNQLTDTHDDLDPNGVEPGNLTTLGDLVGATLVALDAQHAHYLYHQTIVDHDVAAGRVTVDQACDNDNEPGLGWGSKYYVENHPALVDQPGEWWFDRETDRLYLWSPTGANPAELRLEISRLPHGFGLSNRSYITIDGLVIEFFNGPAIDITNVSSGSKAHGISVVNAILRYADQGVLLHQYVGRETSPDHAIDGFLLENSEIGYMDSTAVQAYYWWPGAPGPERFDHAGVRNTVIRNNELHHLGFNSHLRSGVGIRFFAPDRLRFENNHVHHVAQNGVHLHLSLADSPKEYDFAPEEILIGDILIRGNTFEKTCQLASDCGAFKFGGGQRPYNHVFRDVLVTDNIFRDVSGWSHVSIRRGLNELGDGNGLYLDHASGIHVYRNIAYNTTSAGFKLGCLWRDGAVLFYNNIAANNYTEGFELTGCNTYCDSHRGSVNTQIVNNIIANNHARGIDFCSAYEDEAYGNLIIDHNLYFNNGWNPGAAWNPADVRIYRGTRPSSYLHGLNDIRENTPWETNGVEGDPGFRRYDIDDHDPYDGSWPDFRIAADDSPAIDRGTADLPASLIRLLEHFGIEDTRSGDAYDIGRYEVD